MGRLIPSMAYTILKAIYCQNQHPSIGSSYIREELFFWHWSALFQNYVHSYCSLNHVHRIQSPRIKTTDLIDQTLCLSYLYRTPFQFQSFFLVLSQGQQLKDWTAALRIGVQPRTHSEEREHRYTRPLP